MRWSKYEKRLVPLLKESPDKVGSVDGSNSQDFAFVGGKSEITSVKRIGEGANSE
jgi:hypothetical protein